MQASEGTVVGGRYRIIRHLGGGGFGQAFLAEDIHSFGERCVVKKLQPSSPQVLEQARKLFDREGKTLQRLGKHDQIPRLLAYFEEAEEFYLVQEFIPGHDLSRELTSGKRLSEPYAIKILQDVLPILEYVHSQQVIHRDIKPSNIIRREPGGKLVLIDFGAVKQITQVQSHGTIIGTPGYAPPEQRFGEPNYSSDIYALGMVAIQSLTGMAPRSIPQHPDTDEVMWRELASPDIGEALAGILQKMVHPDHRERYQSAARVRQDLAQANSQQKVVIKPDPDGGEISSGNLEPPEEPSKIGPLGKWSVKPWHVISGAAAMGLLLVAVEMLYPIARPFYYVRQGRQLLEEFKPEKALVPFEQSTDLREDYREGWKGQGDALFTLGRLLRALAAYEKVLQLEPDDPDPRNLNNKGKVLYRLGRNQEALAAHSHAIALDRNNASAWHGQGIALIGLGKFSEAIEAFDQARSISPNDPRVWQAKGIALGYLGRKPEALKVYEEALDSYERKLRRDPENLTAWVDKGEVLNKLGRPEEALESYEEALQLNPQHYPALLAKGNVLGTLQKPEEALEAYDEAREIRDTDHLLWYNRGIILSRALHKKPEALESFERVLELNSGFYPALREQGVTLIFLEQHEQALEVFERAKDINPQDPYLWANRGDVLAKMGRKQEAQSSYEKALELNIQPDYVREQVQQKLDKL